MKNELPPSVTWRLKNLTKTMNPAQLKAQTRDLWRECFGDTEAYMDLFFDEKYRAEHNIHLCREGRVVSAAQVLPYRTTLFGSVCRSSYLCGLGTAKAYRGKGLATQILHEAHRHEFNTDSVLSILIPADDGMRHFYERPEHGAYETLTFRYDTDLKPEGEADPSLWVGEPEDWGRDLFVFYHRQSSQTPFMLHPSETDFFAALNDIDLAGGHIVVARARDKIQGLCLTETVRDGEVRVRSLVAISTKVKNALLQYLLAACGAQSIRARMTVPGTYGGRTPYAMGRVIHVEKFLRMVLRANPNLRLHIGVDGDLHVPENNGYYVLERGQVRITDERPPRMVTPGGLAAMFLASQPFLLDLMMDE